MQIPTTPPPLPPAGPEPPDSDLPSPLGDPPPPMPIPGERPPEPLQL
jgi:hypothetical protein